MFLPLVPHRDQDQSNTVTTSLDSMELMGTVLSGIAYGIVFTICILALCANYSPKFSWRTLFTCWLLLLATISTALQIRWLQLAFVTQRQESPSDFIEEHVNNWIYVMLNVLYVVINWSADGILVFRFFTFFNRSLRWSILPAPLYVTSLVTGSLALRELAAPGTIQNTNRLANWLIIYRTVSLSLCVILTSFITGRLIMVHRKGDSGLLRSKSPIGNIVRMLVESAALETASTLVYVITVGLGSPLQNVFLPILGQVQVIAPMLIIYRVVRGRDPIPGLPNHRDKTVSRPSLSIQTGHATSFFNLNGEYSATSPTGSSRVLELPCYSFPPPYAASPLRESLIGNIPQSPSVDPAHMSGVQKLSIRLPA